MHSKARQAWRFVLDCFTLEKKNYKKEEKSKTSTEENYIFGGKSENSGRFLYVKKRRKKKVTGLGNKPLVK